MIPPPRSLRRAYAVSCRETKNPNPLPTANRFGFLDFGGPNRDRTDDLTDAKRHLNLFCIIFDYLWYFPPDFSFFPTLFRTLISMCCAAVCGASCGQNAPRPLPEMVSWLGRGAFFVPLAVWIVPPKAGFSKSFLRRPCLRNWGAVNKTRPCPVSPQPPAPLTRPLRLCAGAHIIGARKTISGGHSHGISHRARDSEKMGPL